MLTRSVVAIAAVLTVGLAGACDVGEAPGGPDGRGGTTDSAPLADADPNCVPATTPVLGHHNAGTGCITANCHGTPLGINAPAYSVAGTLYTDALGTTGVAGGTIIVTDANNVTVELVTGGTLGIGNFWSEQLLTPPFTVRATQCPSLRSMGTPANSGDCNSCHITGGEANARIHL